MLHPQTVTPLYLVLVVNCYVANPFLLARSALRLFSVWGGGVVTAPTPGHSHIYFHRAYAQDHLSTWVSHVSVP